MPSFDYQKKKKFWNKKKIKKIVQVSLSLRRVTLRSIFRSINVHSAHLPLMLTGKAESAQITHRQEISM